MKYKLTNGKLSCIDDIEITQNAERQRDILIINNNVSDSIIEAILKKNEDERSVDELRKIVIRKQINDNYDREIERLNGYLPLREIPYEDEVGEYESLFPVFEENNGFIYKTFKPQRDVCKILLEIDRLKAELSSSDYKVIKMYEAKIMMEEMPYTESVITERQRLRSEINRLEDLLKTV